MFNLYVTSNGTTTELTNNSNYIVASVRGLTPAALSLNTSNGASLDGGFLNSIRTEMRNIVIDLVINEDIEENRIALYNIFRPKKSLKIRFENSVRNLKTDGYVENIECDLFTSRQHFIVSILCPNPFLQSADTAISLPFSIAGGYWQTASFTYAGDVPCGVKTVITATSATAVKGISLNNAMGNGGIRLTFATALTGAFTLTINTRPGEVAVYTTVSDTDTNRLGAVDVGSELVQLQPYESTYLVIGATSDDWTTPAITQIATASAEIVPLYSGV